MRVAWKALMIGAVALSLVLAGCTSGDTGVMRLSVTDAPIVDTDEVTGVYVTFSGVEYNLDGEWGAMTGFGDPKTYNLLELTGGESELLGDLVLPAGTYEQIRFMIAGTMETAAGPPTTTETWVNRDDNEVYDSDTDAALFIPSAAQTGYKATADEPFSVPANGTVSITADFDLRRAVVSAGGRYILKPVVRLVVEDQAGTITGDVTNNTGNDLVVYAYEAEGDAAFTASEAADPVEGESRYPNAVTSFAVEDVDDDATLDYTLAFLAAGDYDLIIAQFNPTSGEYIDGSGEAVDVEAVTVTAGDTTVQDITE